MKKPDIAKRMARQAGVSRAEAADRLDLMVREIIADLKKGRDLEFPGLGRLRHGRDGEVVFERESGSRD